MFTLFVSAQAFRPSRAVVSYRTHGLTGTNLQPFIENYNIDRVRYQQQVKEVFGKELLSE